MNSNNSGEEEDLEEGRRGGGYDNNPGSGDKETRKVVLETLIGLNDCLYALAWAGNERRNSKVSVTQIKSAGGTGLV